MLRASSSSARKTRRVHHAGMLWRVSATGAMFIVAGVLGGAFWLLGENSDDDEMRAADPPRVSTIPAEKTTGYTTTRTYTGRIEPRRQSAMGFELGGLVTDVQVDDGDHIDAGETIATLDTKRLDARRAELVANLDLAEATYERARNSYEKGAASVQELDDAEESRDSTRAALELAERQVESIDVDIAKSTITAPFDAVVAHRMVDEGQVVAAGQPVIELLERIAPEARIGIASHDAAAIASGDAFNIMIEGRSYPGTVRNLLPVTARRTRTVEVVIELDAELDGLRRGDLAVLEIERTIQAEGFWLPVRALTESAHGLWACYVAAPLQAPAHNGTHRIERRQLEVLNNESDRAFVIGTLRSGERVIADGLHRIVTNMHVALEDEQGIAP